MRILPTPTTSTTCSPTWPSSTTSDIWGDSILLSSGYFLLWFHRSSLPFYLVLLIILSNVIKQNFPGLIVGRLVQFRSHFVKHYQIIINSLFLAKSLFCRLNQFWVVQFQHLVAAFIMCESIAHGLLLRCGLCLFSLMGRAWEVVVFSFGVGSCWVFTYIPDNCHWRHWRRQCKFFWPV